MALLTKLVSDYEWIVKVLIKLTKAFFKAQLLSLTHRQRDV